MKKIIILMALCALTMVSSQAAYRVYLCGITELTIDTLQSNVKNQFTLNFHQKCKNTAEYSKPETFYESDVKLVLNSDDRTLEGTYTTEGASTTSSSANVNDQTINLITSEFTSGSTSRLLRKDSISTFTIEKVDETHYAITTGDLYFSKRLDQTTDTWEYRYSYDANEILAEGIEPKPFVFGYDSEYHEAVYNYDMTVNGISVLHDDSDYGVTRYFLTLNCTGTNRFDNTERNYEVQLAIYPGEESIVGTFATQGGDLLYSSNSYVKDLKINKTRYLSNDSISSIQITSKGEDLYSFFGGTLICTDLDANYSAVYGKKRVEAVHYYHFSDNGGQGIEFGYDEDQTVFDLTPTKVTVESQADGFQLSVTATDGSASYSVLLELIGEALAGTYSVANENLSLWSKVERGYASSYVTNGAYVTITSKGNNTYTLTGYLVCDNGNIYTLSAFDFQYGNSNPGGGGDSTNSYNVTATNVTIQDLTIDKYNYFVTVKAHTSTGEYEIAFDVWPVANSPIGSFSASDKTIGYVSSFVHKTKSNGDAVDMWYTPQEDSPISLDIVSNGDGTCTLSGSIQAERNSKAYTYIIAAYTWEYSAEPVVPDPEDPYRFEPKEPTTIDFVADVVAFRDRDTYIEVTLNEMANETYNWIELRLLSDTMAMPASVYRIDSTYAAGTITASKGYLGGTAGDDPSFVAIRADKEEWGQYTPYYLASGSLSVSYNAKGDTIIITGTALSHNGSTIKVHAKSYNMLYVDVEPKEPEFVTLGIDTVVITYMSNLSDSANNLFAYTFNFSHQDDYPQVLVDAILNKPMELVAGTYSLADGTLNGLQLSQNQEDFEMNIFAGGAYNFVSAILTLTPGNNGQWRYEMEMHDAIGSEYTFAFSQTPHIILYPEPAVDPKDQPYMDEQQEPTTITLALDTMVWDAKTVQEDGIIDIYLMQRTADADGLRAYMALGMYTDQAYPAAGTYPVDGSEANGTFSASMGRYGSTLFPCYAALMDKDGWAHAVWYIVCGDITLSYEGEEPVLSGECTSYFGSTIRFAYRASVQGIETAKSQKPKAKSYKVLHDGQIVIIREGKKYSIMGQEVR